MATDDIDLALVDAHEERLIELAAALEHPFERRTELLAVSLLALRSRSLFIGMRDCAKGSAPVAARPALRALVEANITMRFITERDVELRFDLWEGERDRTRLTLDQRLRDLKLPRYPPLLSDADRTATRQRVEALRARALAAGTPGVGPGGAIFPGTGAQVASLKSPAVSEAYAMAYGLLSADVHLGAASFDDVGVYQLESGQLRLEEGARSQAIVAGRVLGITTFASTIVMADSYRAVGIAEDADDIKRIWIPHELALGERTSQR